MNDTNSQSRRSKSPLRMFRRKIANAFGAVTGFFNPPEIPGADKTKRPVSLFWTVLIILATLIFSTTRDLVILQKRRDIISNSSEQIAELLKKNSKQSELIEGLKTDLKKISGSDPVAARILTDFFSPPAPPKESQEETELPTSSPPLK